MIADKLIIEAPKVLLHTHLEGSIPLVTLSRLAKKNQCRIDLPIIDSKSFDWKLFLNSYSQICNCLKDKYDIYDGIVSYVNSLSRQNVKYAELHFTPWAHLSRGITKDEIKDGIKAALGFIDKEFDVKLNFIFDLTRSHDENCYELIEWIKGLREFVVAIGFSGDGTGKALQTYDKFCSYIKSIGFKLVAHVGELDGASSVDTAVNVLRVDRITHGVRVLEDEQLFNKLVEIGMHFELCPTSNRYLGIIDEAYSEIATIIKAGAKYSINPDDETLFQTNISKEILLLERMGLLSAKDIQRLTVEAMQSSFANDKIKAHNIELINKYWTHNGNDTN